MQMTSRTIVINFAEHQWEQGRGKGGRGSTGAVAEWQCGTKLVAPHRSSSGSRQPAVASRQSAACEQWPRSLLVTHASDIKHDNEDDNDNDNDNDDDRQQERTTLSRRRICEGQHRWHDDMARRTGNRAWGMPDATPTKTHNHNQDHDQDHHQDQDQDWAETQTQTLSQSQFQSPNCGAHTGGSNC
ncbi:GL11713 [Drosophila persimilis]|uniref:GL11713 n=1 Tax=Drosophila persimilis TaxID=7234 RepID=B4H3K4_DROPE|nr:GL11713 [Drosophila persimilis]